MTPCRAKTTPASSCKQPRVESVTLRKVFRHASTGDAAGAIRWPSGGARQSRQRATARQAISVFPRVTARLLPSAMGVLAVVMSSIRWPRVSLAAYCSVVRLGPLDLSEGAGPSPRVSARETRIEAMAPGREPGPHSLSRHEVRLGRETSTRGHEVVRAQAEAEAEGLAVKVAKKDD